MGRVICAPGIVATAANPAGCTRESVTEDTRPTSASAADIDTTGDFTGATTVAEVVTAPDKYFGKTVTVIADVQEAHGTNAFVLDEDAPLSGGIDQDLLVFSRPVPGLGGY